MSLRGAPYRNGGSDPAGFDCSGFVRYVFGQNGVAVPRTVTEQFRAGRQVHDKQLEAGDLVFFSTVSAWLTIACDARPLMSTTKPTPQASCS